MMKFIFNEKNFFLRFKMLTTDLEPSDGTIFINENNQTYTDALLNKKMYWSHIGYCPQFDALYDELTPSDHIRLFARIKGVRTKYEAVLCESLLKRLDLLQYADKPGKAILFIFESLLLSQLKITKIEVGSLSLGNKRKLSTALSFVGNPSVVNKNTSRCYLFRKNLCFFFVFVFRYYLTNQPAEWTQSLVDIYGKRS